MANFDGPDSDLDLSIDGCFQDGVERVDLVRLAKENLDRSPVILTVRLTKRPSRLIGYITDVDHRLLPPSSASTYEHDHADMYMIWQTWPNRCLQNVGCLGVAVPV